MLNFGPHFLDQHSRDTLVMDSPPHPPSESGPRKCAMIKLVVLLWLSIMTPSVSDSEGGCGGESITKSGPTKSWSKQEFAIFISILIYTYGIRVKYADKGAKNEQTSKMRKSQKRYNHKNFIF